ncbi:hypothetical protein NHP190003_00490 [Helicobacter sp. NHP19-003]|uniref:SH3b domain-containing protein n=1 Tax=Helicobacter gastrocanis TaxID=2849641 RepID=A0ABN6I1Q1_9HELI|nr:SH3 domain-containing protein [Helicobacter sp. NHP19-003]BCZ16767.1 hypothetical protein NHP190003_00490 [Helicobacter sp. NHP19-003]
MALKFFKLYGYGLGVVVLCLGVYVGVFIAQVKHKGAEQAQIKTPRAQEKITERAQVPKGATPTTNTETKETTETKAPKETKEPTKVQEQATTQEAQKEAKAIETKQTQEATAKDAQKPTTKEQSTEAKEGAKEPPYTIYHVGVSAVNVRAKPSTHAPVVVKILRGQEVRVLEVKEGWGRVDKGWVYLQLLKKDQ